MIKRYRKIQKYKVYILYHLTKNIFQTNKLFLWLWVWCHLICYLYWQMHSLGKPKVAVLSHENNNIYVHFCINNTTTETVYVLSVFWCGQQEWWWSSKTLCVIIFILFLLHISFKTTTKKTMNGMKCAAPLNKNDYFCCYHICGTCGISESSTHTKLMKQIIVM